MTTNWSLSSSYMIATICLYWFILSFFGV